MKKDRYNAIATCVAAMTYETSAHKDTLLVGNGWLPARVWMSFPAWSGGMIDRLPFDTSDVGDNIANDAVVVLATAYLYKACRHAGLLLQPWKDMYWFLELVRQERPFIHEVGPEGHMATFARRLYLGMGVSAAALSHDDGRSLVRGLRSSRQTFEQRRIFWTGSECLQLVGSLLAEDCGPQC